MIIADRAVVEEHYAEHVGKPFYEDVCAYLTSGPIVVLAIRGQNAVRAVRAMMGATNPVEAEPGMEGYLELKAEYGWGDIGKAAGIIEEKYGVSQKTL